MSGSNKNTPPASDNSGTQKSSGPEADIQAIKKTLNEFAMRLKTLEENSVAKVEFEALEKAVNVTVETVVKKTASSVTVEKADDAARKPEKPRVFDIKGVGKVRLKVPSFQIGKNKYNASDIEKDPELAKELYEARPNLFVKPKNSNP